jgi:hypothetical protein
MNDPHPRKPHGTGVAEEFIHNLGHLFGEETVQVQLVPDRERRQTFIRGVLLMVVHGTAVALYLGR